MVSRFASSADTGSYLRRKKNLKTLNANLERPIFLTGFMSVTTATDGI